jgi:hypothetical protein
MVSLCKRDGWCKFPLIPYAALLTFFSAHTLEWPCSRLFLLIYELARGLIALGPVSFAHHLGLELAALAHCTFAGIVTGRFVDSHADPPLRMPPPTYLEPLEFPN